MELYDSESGEIKMKSAADVYNELIVSINKVYDDVVLGDGFIDKDKHPEEHYLFDNPFRAVDGPCYAFLAHGLGPAVGGQGENFLDDDTVTSSNVVIKGNTINDIKCWNNEVPALFGVCGDHGCAVADTRGSVFQTRKTFDSEDSYLAMGPDGKYKTNVVADMQIMVAQAILNGVLSDIPSRQTAPNSIHQGIIDWAQTGSVMTPQYICNGDSMHHVMKGIIVIRVEDTKGFTIEDNIIDNVENLSVGPFSNCDAYHRGASSENQDEGQAGNVRAISVAAVRGFENDARLPSQIQNNEIRGVLSLNPKVIIGIDVQGDSKDLGITKNNVDLLHENLFEENFDKCIAVRVREHVGSSVTLKNNYLAQKIQVLNSGIRGRARYLNNVPHPHMSGDIEWRVGGCPLASDYTKK